MKIIPRKTKVRTEFFKGITLADIIVGVVGIVGASVNYFIYQKLLQKGKMKYGNDILRLAKEISEE